MAAAPAAHSTQATDGGQNQPQGCPNGRLADVFAASGPVPAVLD